LGDYGIPYAALPRGRFTLFTSNSMGCIKPKIDRAILNGIKFSGMGLRGCYEAQEKSTKQEVFNN
jgi:hypothetical protein